MPKIIVPADFADTLNKFVAAAQGVINAHFAQNLKNLVPDTLSIQEGSRYVRIVSTKGGSPNSQSVYCFVDKTNGDILKAATWRAPAKHARGSIHAADHGVSAVNSYGANYLK